jgi:penicillin amidase
LRTVLRVLFWIFTIVVLIVGGVAWWLVYRPLPQLDGKVVLSGLQDEVRVERDRWGVPHIRANSVEDLAEAQGYVMAQDRLWQMDLLRRIGRGRLSEILGAATVEIDRDFRTLGIARAAERDAGSMDPEARRLLEAYARGVNQFVEQHQKDLPLEFSLLQYKPQPWQVSDTLVITGYMYRTLANTWQRKLERAKVSGRVGAERAKELYSPEAAMDRFVIGDPNIADDGSQRSHASNDEDDDEDDVAADTVFKASADPPGPALRTGTPKGSISPDVPSSFVLGSFLPAFLETVSNEVRNGLGSNNWAVSGAHTATGKPLLANDTHLDLVMPPIWYQVHQTAPGFNVQGFALPGGPPVVIGHNERIAW